MNDTHDSEYAGLRGSHEEADFLDDSIDDDGLIGAGSSSAHAVAPPVSTNLVNDRVVDGTRRVSIGWLPAQEDGLRIALAGLVASVALNRDKCDADGAPSAVDAEWADAFLKRVVTQFIGLSEDMAEGILPLLRADADPAPLARVWTDGQTTEDRERAFGELLAQSILAIGGESGQTPSQYDSRAHRCLVSVARELCLSQACTTEFENLIAALVVDASEAEQQQRQQQQQQLSEEERRDKSRSRMFRNLKVGAAAVVGAVAVGVTGGLALPAIGASLAAFGGVAATTGAFVATAGGTALFTTLFSAGGMSLTGYKMSRRLGSSLTEFEFRQLDARARRRDGNLHVSILVSGWAGDVKAASKLEGASAADADVNVDVGEAQQATDAKADVDDVAEAQQETDAEEAQQKTDAEAEQEAEQEAGKASALEALRSGEATKRAQWDLCAQTHRAALGESFELVWETQALRDVSSVMTRFAMNQVVSKAVSEALARTALATLMSAIALPHMVMGAANYIDNSFSVASNRARLAGEELGRAILSGAHGRRPVSLVGYCLGGLVVFHCLAFLARSGSNKRRVDGLVLDAVILGAPVTASDAEWRAVRGVVAGALVNAHSGKDWMLALLYRSTALSASRIAGLSPVTCAGVTNLDVSKCARTQMEYHQKLAACMDLVGPSLTCVQPSVSVGRK